MNGIPTLSEDEFPLRFSVDSEDRGIWPLEALFASIVAALGLPPTLTPMYTSSRSSTARTPRLREKLDGFARINGVRGATADGQKIAMISHSFFLKSQGALLIWSNDLDDSIPFPELKKPNEVWFRDGTQPVLLTNELKATVKAIAVKKGRSPGKSAAKS